MQFDTTEGINALGICFRTDINPLFVKRTLILKNWYAIFIFDERLEQALAYINDVCETEGLNVIELKSGGRRGPISRIRAQIAVVLIKNAWGRC